MVADDIKRTESGVVVNDGKVIIPSEGLGEMFFRSMQQHQNKIAQILPDTDVTETYGDLLTRSIKTAISIRSRGILRTDIVCICSYNQKNAFVPFIASQFLGIQVASLDPTLSIKEITHLLKLISPRIIFIVSECLAKIEEACLMADIKPKQLVIFDSNSGANGKYENFERDYLDTGRFSQDEVKCFRPVHINTPKETAVIHFSSGVTGLPKAICLNHISISSQCENYLDEYLSSTTIHLSYATSYWVTTSQATAFCICNGVARVLCKSFDKTQFWNLIQKYQITSALLSPLYVMQILESDTVCNKNVSSLKVLTNAGGSLTEHTIQKLRDMVPGMFVVSGYGQTESPQFICNFKPSDRNLAYTKPGSVGLPLQATMCKILDISTGAVLGPNEHGELHVKSPYVMNGYLNRDSSDVLDSTGWLNTGDIAYYDTECCFYIVGRTKEMFKYKGWHVSPASIERELLKHPAVSMGVVIGTPHDQDGCLPTAVVVLKPNYFSENDVRHDIEEFVNASVCDNERLRGGVRIVKSFPATPTGKVQRIRLQTMISNGLI